MCYLSFKYRYPPPIDSPATVFRRDNARKIVMGHWKLPLWLLVLLILSNGEYLAQILPTGTPCVYRTLCPVSCCAKNCSKLSPDLPQLLITQVHRILPRILKVLCPCSLRLLPLIIVPKGYPLESNFCCTYSVTTISGAHCLGRRGGF